MFLMLCPFLQGEMRPVRCQTEAENMKIRSPKFPKQVGHFIFRVFILYTEQVNCHELMNEWCGHEGRMKVSLCFCAVSWCGQEESILLVLEMSFRIVSDLLMKNASTEWKSSELQKLHDLLGNQRQFYTACVSSYKPVPSHFCLFVVLLTLQE